MNLLKVLEAKNKLERIKKRFASLPATSDNRVNQIIDDSRTEYQIYVDRPDHRSEQYPEAYPQLIWYTRAEARDFKKLLKSSTRKLKGRIIRREWDSGFVLSEEEVW